MIGAKLYAGCSIRCMFENKTLYYDMTGWTINTKAGRTSYGYASNAFSGNDYRL
jgi:hypothetical protein